MARRMYIQWISLALIAAIIFQPAILWAGDSWKEIDDLAQEDMKQLDEGVIDVAKFCGEPWYKRHWGKLAAGTVIVIGGAAIFFSGGLAAPAVGAGAAHFVGTGAAITAGEAALGAATAAGAAGVYIDKKGNITIPENKKWEVKRFYRENYKSWINRSSTKKEFGELALGEIVKFLSENK